MAIRFDNKDFPSRHRAFAAASAQFAALLAFY
jgi:hypothetical protein